jgi:hypothetical protein
MGKFWKEFKTWFNAIPWLWTQYYKEMFVMAVAWGLYGSAITFIILNFWRDFKYLQL